jgi:hypothetical protein
MDMDIGHAVWAWTRSLDTDISMDKHMLLDHIHVANPYPCCMSQNMLRVYVGAACRLFMPEARAIAARTCPCPCCISMFMSMLHVSPFSMGMGMLHRRGHIARTGHAAWTLIRSINIDMDTGMNNDMGMVKTWT